MRINQENKSMDMEVRDINYILPAYVRSYLFYCKNEMPEKIIFPMFPSVKVGDIYIPIEYVPPLDAIAVDIAEDGSNIVEVTPGQEAKIDEKDEEIKRLKAELAQTGRGGEDEVGDTPADEPPPEPKSPARAAFAKDDEEPKGTPIEIAKNNPGRHTAFTVDPDPTHQPSPDRKPKDPPGGDIGTGQSLSDMHARDRRDQARTAKDLVVDADIEGSVEKEFDKNVSRDGKGRPVVEDKKC